MLDIKAINLFLDEVAEAKGLDKNELFSAIEDAMGAAYKKEYGDRGQVVRAKIDHDTGEVNFFRVKEVVTSEQIISDEDYDAMSKDEYMKLKDQGKTKFIEEKYILLDTAKLIKADAKAGDELTFDLEQKDDFGRLAAMTAKQTIKRKLLDVERNFIQKEYGDLEGTVVYGKVLREDNGSYYVDLGKIEAVLPFNEQIKGEKYKTGDQIKAYLLRSGEMKHGVELRLSRTHPEFLKKLFELEVPELRDGVVEIKKIVREPGKRSKIAVESYTDGVDAVGTFVGQSGSRSAVISSELSGEKLDIIEYSEDANVFIENSLSPAEVLSIDVDEENKKASVIVPKEQISLAIGRGGQNARLVAKLTGFKVDIQTDEEKKIESNEGENDKVDVEDKIEGKIDEIKKD